MKTTYSMRTVICAIATVVVLFVITNSYSATSNQNSSGNANQTAAAATVTPPMTLILVRHAEKKIVPPENKDPDISEAGEARANQIAKMFGNSGINAIYASEFKRTQQTVKPLSDKTGIAVIQADAKKSADLVTRIKANNAGQVVFIAGHNNTVPEIIAGLGGPQLPIIPEDEFDNLFILTIDGTGSAKLLRMKY